MKKKILMVSKSKGLNKNLLRLALSPWDNSVLLIEPSELENQPLGGFNTIIVDHQAIPEPEKLPTIFTRANQDTQFLYLMDRPIDEKIKQELPGWFFLAKPFEPKALQKLIAGS